MTVLTAPNTWSEVQALPTEKVEFPKSMSSPKGARRVETRWFLSEREVERHGKPAVERIVVELGTSHYGKAEYWGRPEKCYRTTLSYAKETKDGTFTTLTFGVYSQTSILVHEETEVARYSAKGMLAAHEAALATLEAIFEGSNCPKVFAEALERHAGSEA